MSCQPLKHEVAIEHRQPKSCQWAVRSGLLSSAGPMDWLPELLTGRLTPGAGMPVHGRHEAVFQSYSKSQSAGLAADVSFKQRVYR